MPPRPKVINPFPAQLRELSADPYDDTLMESFCAFLEQGQARIDKVELIYRSQVCPPGGQAFALDLYHCLSLVKDALTELERYTMGYVDSYLHDGRAATLDQAIRAHGGEATVSRDRFLALSAEDRALLILFLGEV